MKDEPSSCTRRGFLQVGLGLAAGVPLILSGACGSSEHNSTPPPPPARSDAKVAIVSCKTYDLSEVQDALSQALPLLGDLRTLVNGKVVDSVTGVCRDLWMELH